MRQLFFIVVLVLQSPAWALSVDDQAPIFSLETLRDGAMVELQNYRGKVVYVDFWASWCTPCRQSFPALSSLRKKYVDQGFEIIAVNLDKDQPAAMRFLETHPTDYPIVSGYGSEVPKEYEVIAMPTGYIIDGMGKVRLVHLGFKADQVDFLEAVLEKLLAEL